MSQLNWGELIKEAAASGSGSYEPLPDGDYELKVVEASATTTQTGKAMFKVKSEVQTGAYARRLLWDNLVVSPENGKAMNMFFMKLGALGITQESLQANQPSNEQIAQALVGRPFRATVGTRVWNGENRNEFKRYLPAAPVGSVSAPAPAAAAPAPAPAPAPQVAAAPAPAPAPAPAAPAPAVDAFAAPAPAAPLAESAPPAPPF